MLLLHHAGHAATPPCRSCCQSALSAILGLAGHDATPPRLVGHAATRSHWPCCQPALSTMLLSASHMLLLGLAGHAATRPRWPCCNSASLKMLLIGLAGHTVTPPHWPCCYSATPAMLLLVLAGHATTANLHSEAGQHLLPPSLVFSIQIDSRSIGGVIRGSTSFGYIYLWSGGGWEPALQRGHSH